MGEPVGENSWMSLVDGASRAAGDLEQRVEVVELYKRAVGAEPFSLRLWLAYCEWIWSLYTDCQSGDAGWSEEEQLLGQELFSLEVALDIWQQGAQATRYRLNDSHMLWNRWMSIELEELAKSPEPPAIEHIKSLFIDRLQTPHAAWDETSQTFSTFVTRYDESAWEKTMVTVTQLAKTAKELYSQRGVHELKLQSSITSGDKEAQEAAMIKYLEWEVTQCGKKNGSPALLFALYERALLMFHTNSTIWEDYVVAVSDSVNKAQSKPGKTPSVLSDPSTTPDVLTILQRATQHCLWSGSLWSRYILRAELEGLSFSEVEQIKHAATGSGQLDRNGMTDVLAVYSAWCGFLRRRAVSENASDEDVDIADVGLSSALESFQEWGERLYGKKVYKGDPSFRLEQCLIQYLTQKGHISEARSQWQKLVKSHGDSYEFWQRYYLWEMAVDHLKSTRPSATAVLRQAVTRGGLDWPEKIMEIYLQHCETYEDPQTLAEAVDFVHTYSKGVAKRRQREAAEAATAYVAQQEHQAEPAIAEPATNMSPSGASKRKRDSVTDMDSTVSKKIKGNMSDNQVSQHVKRDRENTTVLVTNLPPEITQTKVRQYFKEYGHINNLTVKAEEDGLSSTALIEFRSPEEVQSAMIKDGKYFGDKQIHVETGTGLTLYVTNYPPTADEAYMRELFAECGEIFSIRWPSLKYNTHRRFCYISFRSASAAAAATQLDGKLLEGRYKLEAKYSDPAKKKTREGAGAEGREIHIANIDRTATEDDLREVFSKYGNVESVRILKNVAGRSKGGGFVVFEKKEEAKEALALDKTKFKSQILTVELSTQTNYKPTATTIGSKASSASPAPDGEGDFRMSNSPAPDSQAASTQAQHDPSKAEIAARTIAVMNIPDTVNDARIRAVAEPYGTIVKLTLRPDHQGAIVEYSDAAAAGRASLGLGNHEIVPGRKLRTGGLKDLFQEKGEIRVDRIQVGTGAKKPPTAPRSGFMQPTVPVRRPGSGVRGGLGAKRGLGYSSALGKKASVGDEHANGNGTAVGKNEKKVQPKSNADFKAMFLKSEGQ
jgi:RNA recognition motif-containing protein